MLQPRFRTLYHTRQSAQIVVVGTPAALTPRCGAHRLHQHSGRTGLPACSAAARVTAAAAAGGVVAAAAASENSHMASLEDLAQEAVVWASQHGLVVGLGDEQEPAALVHAPLSLLPVAFPRERFLQAKAAMQEFNTLIDLVAADEAYLARVLAPAAASDTFTAALLRVLEESAEERASARAAGVPDIMLGVHRSDYMLDEPSGGFLQVELNTIASSFGCLSSITRALHAHMLDRVAAGVARRRSGTRSGSSRQEEGALPPTTTAALSSDRLPPNDAMAGIARALAAATVAAGGGEAVMLMVVQPGERNAYDQQWLQQTLWERHGIETRRLSLAEMLSQLELRDRQQPAAFTVTGAKAAAVAATTSTAALVADVPGRAAAAAAAGAAAAGGGGGGGDRYMGIGGRELVFKACGTKVGLVYYRAGYTPADYPTEAEWQARMLVELSSAAKCPSVAYQLAGAKKVQQDLAAPGVVERFIGQQRGAALRGLFAGLWSLDDPAEPATAAVIADALSRPWAYVLKPQREGGGNNLYGSELAAALSAGLEQHQQSQAAAQPLPHAAAARGGGSLSAYILMQRIVPPAQRSAFVRRGKLTEDDSLSELGIYGTFLRIGDEVVMNEEVGHLVRTKTASSDEGGVAAGYAVLDSPLLCEEADGLLPQNGGAGTNVDRGSGGRGVLEAARAALGC